MTPAPNAEAEVVDLVSALIRFDTSNTGELETTKGEAECAQLGGRAARRGRLRDRVRRVRRARAGATCSPGCRARTARRGALLIHGHLDVVPAEAADWSVHPFSGAVEDGYVWGRGAVDMKDMVGMMIAVARHFKRAGIVPPRDLVFAFVADEEAGGKYGCAVAGRQPARPVRGRHRGDRRGRRLLADGAAPRRRRTPALPDRDRREGACMWMRLTARGRAGHGSMIHDDNAVTAVAEAVARLGRHQFPLVLTDTVAQFLAGRQRGDRATRSTPTRPTWTGRSPSSARSPGSSAPRCATPPTRPCSRPATRPTSSPRPRRRWSTAACCPAG